MVEYKLVYGDCLEIMPKIPDKAIDMILCDLPYQVTRAAHDIAIPFEPMWEQYERIIKDNGAIVLFGQGLFAYKLALSNEKLYRYDLVWKKGERCSGFLDSKKKPLRNHELILVFYKNQPTYNPQMELSNKKNNSRGKMKEIKNQNYGYMENVDTPSEEKDGKYLKYPKSILNFDRPHPPIFATQKPVELCEWLIKTYTNENEIVLDNAAGSGTTIISAINTNRRVLGIEKDHDNYLLAKGRVEKHVNDTRCGDKGITN